MPESKDKNRGGGSAKDRPAFYVDTEIGKLRKVIVHRPDLELRRLTPSNRDELLFDDVLWVREARREHDVFVDQMRDRGVEVFLLRDLLAETLADETARRRAVELTVTDHTVGVGAVDEILGQREKGPGRPG